jgi:DNA-directed RNA polymerase subunit RPC12/RpoP
MKKLRHTCETCDSEFVIEYDEETTESDPLHCPFCSEYIIEGDEIEDE